VAKAQALIDGETEEQRQERSALNGRYRAEGLANLRADLLRAAKLPNEARNQTFETFEVRSRSKGGEPRTSQNDAIYAARVFVDRLPDMRRGLMLYGATGCGKSHLALAIARAATQKELPVSVHYVNCFELARVMRSDPELGDWMLDCKLLVLDDLDKGLTGDAAPWVRALLKGVIDSIEKQGQPILMSTTEGGPAEWERDFKEYLVGRVKKLMHWREMIGPDGRDEKYQPEDGRWWTYD
jgi:DNA replication protein DnaC